MKDNLNYPKGPVLSDLLAASLMMVVWLIRWGKKKSEVEKHVAYHMKTHIFPNARIKWNLSNLILHFQKWLIKGIGENKGLTLISHTVI